MIKLNDILKFDRNALQNTKIRFNLQFGGEWDPLLFLKNQDMTTILDGHYWNNKHKAYPAVGTITIGFIPVDRASDTWVLVHVGRVTKDLNVFDGVGYEYEKLSEFDAYIGRLIVKWHNKSQAVIRKAETVIDQIEVYELLPGVIADADFPGYDQVNISFTDLKRVINNHSWKTALENQKGVYLITDRATGKLYVGSAYGDSMLLGRWRTYLKNGHGGNAALKKLVFEYIEANFTFSILDIFKSTTPDQTIIDRETWWKNVLMTREFGYNDN